VVDTIGLSDDTFVDNYRTPHTNGVCTSWNDFKMGPKAERLWDVSISGRRSRRFQHGLVGARQTYHPRAAQAVSGDHLRPRTTAALMPSVSAIPARRR